MCLLSRQELDVTGSEINQDRGCTSTFRYGDLIPSHTKTLHIARLRIDETLCTHCRQEAMPLKE